MEPIRRLLESRITAKIQPNKVVLIFGARRVGKTVLMRQLISNFNGKTLFLNGEDYDALALLNEQTISDRKSVV